MQQFKNKLTFKGKEFDLVMVNEPTFTLESDTIYKSRPSLQIEGFYYAYIPIKEDVDWIDEWLNLFPEGVKNAGKPVRSDRAICLNKMKGFIKKFPYSADEIIKATKDYLDERANKDYAYTMLAANFINHRDKGSLLAELCMEARTNKRERVIHKVSTGEFI